MSDGPCSRSGSDRGRGRGRPACSVAGPATTSVSTRVVENAASARSPRSCGTSASRFSNVMLERRRRPGRSASPARARRSGDDRHRLGRVARPASTAAPAIGPVGLHAPPSTMAASRTGQRRPRSRRRSRSIGPAACGARAPPGTTIVPYGVTPRAAIQATWADDDDRECSAQRASRRHQPAARSRCVAKQRRGRRRGARAHDRGKMRRVRWAGWTPVTAATGHRSRRRPRPARRAARRPVERPSPRSVGVQRRRGAGPADRASPAAAPPGWPPSPRRAARATSAGRPPASGPRPWSDAAVRDERRDEPRARRGRRGAARGLTPRVSIVRSRPASTEVAKRSIPRAAGPNASPAALIPSRS